MRRGGVKGDGECEEEKRGEEGRGVRMRCSRFGH